MKRLLNLLRPKQNETYKLTGVYRLSVSKCKCIRRKSSLRYWFVVACACALFCVSCRIERNFIRLISIDTNNQSYTDTCAVKEVITPFHRTIYCKYIKDSRR